MCAIAGIFGLVAEDLAAKALSVMAHRGPDDDGILSDAVIPVTLGHRRLSILDTTPAGHQPMTYGNGRLSITFNGEIYNFRELRAELEKRGLAFHTHSDTEVILAAYTAWGTACVERLRGMFAFALADRDPPAGQPAFLLVRDRLGIKPLLHTSHGNVLYFASELRGIVAMASTSPRVSASALASFLSVGSVMQPDTMLENIHMLPPGHLLRVLPSGQLDVVRYWDLHERTRDARRDLASVTPEDGARQLRALLEEATRCHLVADVPVGAFLSGGVDSTAVVTLMQRASSHKVRTFSLGFEPTHGSLDERSRARAAAGRIGTDHEDVVILDREVPALFEKALEQIDQPSVDGFNTWLVSRAAGRVMKVVISGLGGDELFAGYPHVADFSRIPEPPMDSAPPALLVGLLRCRPLTRVAWLAAIRRSSMNERMALLRRLLQDYEFSGFVRPDVMKSNRRRVSDYYRSLLPPDGDSVQRTTYGDIRMYLLNTLLRDSDCMSMSHGLELRPVLLDHPLVEFAYALPERLKQDGFTAKKVFLAAMGDCLPAYLGTHPKMGFTLPYQRWMAGPLRDHFMHVLHSEEFRLLFTDRYTRALQRRLRIGRPPFALWGWGILTAWMQSGGRHVDSTSIFQKDSSTVGLGT